MIAISVGLIMIRCITCFVHIVDDAAKNVGAGFLKPLNVVLDHIDPNGIIANDVQCLVRDPTGLHCVCNLTDRGGVN